MDGPVTEFAVSRSGTLVYLPEQDLRARVTLASHPIDP